MAIKMFWEILYAIKKKICTFVRKCGRPIINSYKIDIKDKIHSESIKKSLNKNILK